MSSDIKINGEKNLSILITSMQPELSAQEYVFSTLTHYDQELLAQLQPLSTFVEQEGMSLIVEKPMADKFDLAYSGVFKCITLKVHSSLDAIGLTAVVANTLAQVNISANVVAAHYHDHVFVAAKHAQEALNRLQSLSANGLKDWE